MRNASIQGDGINIVAPPMFALLTVEMARSYLPSTRKTPRLPASTSSPGPRTFRHSGRWNNGFYYQTIDSAIQREGDMMTVLDVLAREVKILGIFSDWPATVTYYANCMGLK